MAAPSRLPLSRDRILQAALELADAEGVESLTMRRLGDELGFEAMSLYRHVANKSDLLDGMLDLVLTEWQPPDGRSGWPEAIRTSALSVHDALRRHRWAAQLLMSGSHIRPARLQYMDSLLASLREAGFAADTTYHVYHLLDGYIFGFTLWEIAYTAIPLDDEAVTRLMQSIRWDLYPDLAGHKDQHLVEGPHREANAFVVGLDLILAGLEKTLAAQPRTAADDGRSTP
jgi:AcrR family transcriptional regulator